MRHKRAYFQTRRGLDQFAYIVSKTGRSFFILKEEKGWRVVWI